MNHRDLHVLTHSFPTRRSTDLTVYMNHVSAGGTLAAGSTNYLGPVGTETAEGNAHQIILADGVLTHLAANAGGSPGTGKNFTVTVMINGGASVLTCAISEGGVSASDIAHYVNVSAGDVISRSEEHTSELQSLMRNSYAVFC